MTTIGIRTNKTDPNSLLVVAASDGNISAANYLLGNGADIHVWDERPLRVAALYGHKDMVAFLISRGACFEKAFAWAAELGDVGTTSRLLELNPGSMTERVLRAAFDHLAKAQCSESPSQPAPLVSPRWIGPVYGFPPVPQP